jgi:dTMP kinase
VSEAPKPAPNGFFLTLEGGEGAGKTTLGARLAHQLRADGLEVVQTREPGGTAGALAVRALLVRGDGDRWSALSETLLIAAARRDHVERVIAPALERGAVVICDRFRDSTLAYQVAGRGLPGATEAAIAAIIDAPEPALTLLLDIAPEMGLARSAGAEKGESRYEAMALAFHAQVRAAFLAIADASPQRVAVLDAGLPADHVFQAALTLVRTRLN